MPGEKPAAEEATWRRTSFRLARRVTAEHIFKAGEVMGELGTLLGGAAIPMSRSHACPPTDTG